MYPNNNVESNNVVGALIGDGAMQHQINLDLSDIISLAAAMALGVFVGMALFEGVKLAAK